MRASSDASGSGRYEGDVNNIEIRRFPALPSLELGSGVDMQMGGRFFENVPQRMRENLWKTLVEGSAFGRECIYKYPELQTVTFSPARAHEIAKDVPRTFPDVPQFATEAGQRKLTRVLRSYCLLDPEVGYCQGMNFLAGVLLRYLARESDAFGAFCVLMRDKKYRELYRGPNMVTLQRRMRQLERLVERWDIGRRLVELQVRPELFVPQWFLSCFSNSMATTFSARVIDAMLSQESTSGESGDLLMKVAVTILSHLSADVLRCQDFESCVRTVSDVPRSWEREKVGQVLSQALQLRWTDEQLSIMRSEKEEQPVPRANHHLPNRHKGTAVSYGGGESQASPAPTEGAGDRQRHSLLGPEFSTQLSDHHHSEQNAASTVVEQNNVRSTNPYLRDLLE